MPGPVNLNPDFIPGRYSKVRKTKSGRYQLMTDDTTLDYKKGQIIPSDKGEQLMNQQRTMKATKSAMRDIYRERGYDAWSDVPADERAEIERQARDNRQEAYEQLERLKERDDLSPRERRRRRREIRRDAFDS